MANEIILINWLASSTYPVFSKGKEILNTGVINSAILNQTAPPLPVHYPAIFPVSFTSNTEWLPLVADLRNDWYIVENSNLTCPVQPPSVQFYNPSNIQMGPTNPFKFGFYYRTPIGSVVNGFITSKYHSSLPKPYAAGQYPVNDIYYGQLLIKTFVAWSSVPDDCQTITESNVSTDLQRIVNSIIAM